MSTLNIAIQIAGQDQGAGALISRLAGGLGDLGGVATGALTLGLGAATAGIAALGVGLGLAVSEAMGAQQIMAQTEAVIKSTGGAAGMTAEAVADLATQLSLQSRFSDDAIQAGENLLLTFTNIGADVFPDATQAMVDMATAMGTDVKGGAIQLGKALNDPIAGISALSRVGVSFTEDQKSVIKSLVETGDVAGAQAIILAELNKEFGGSAAAAAETFGGKLDVVKNQLLNVAEAIGGPLLDMGGQLIDTLLLPLIPIIQTVGGTFTDFLATFAAGDFEDPIGNLANLFYTIANALGLDGAGIFGAVIALRDPFDSLIATIQTAIPAIQSTFQTAWDFIVTHTEEIKGALLAIGAVLGGAAIVGAIAAIGGVIATLLSPVGLIIGAVALLGAAWAGNWGGIRDILTDFWTNTAQPALSELWQWLQVTVPAALQVLSAYWTTTLLPAMQSVIAWVVENWPKVQTTIETVITTIGTIIQTVMTTVQAFWAANGDAILAKAAEIWAGIHTAISTAITVAGQVITAVATGIQTFWAAHGATILATASAIWAAIVAAVTGFINTISTVITTVSNGIATFWSAWGDTIQQVWVNFTEGIAALVDGFFALLEGDWTTFGESMRTLWSEMWQNLNLLAGEAIEQVLAIDWLGLGVSIVTGIANGITSMNQFLADAALNAAKAAFEAAKAFLGIASPSKLFAGLGANMMAGMALGINATAGLPASATANAAAGAAMIIDNRSYTVQAQYGYQAEGTVAQELALMGRLYQ